MADDAVNIATVRPGSTFRAHLRDDVTLDGTALAKAGAPVRLIVVERTKTDLGDRARIALERFVLPAGELPVAPDATDLAAIAPGTVIAAKTLGIVELQGGRVVIRVPLPETPAQGLDTPSPFYTALPARTPQPLLDRGRGRGPRGSPSPSPEPSASPG